MSAFCGGYPFSGLCFEGKPWYHCGGSPNFETNLYGCLFFKGTPLLGGMKGKPTATMSCFFFWGGPLQQATDLASRFKLFALTAACAWMMSARSLRCTDCAKSVAADGTASSAMTSRHSPLARPTARQPEPKTRRHPKKMVLLVAPFLANLKRYPNGTTH